MAIVIFSESLNIDPTTGSPISRSAYFYISSGVEVYMHNRGALALTGSLQTILNGIESELWTEAQAGGQLPTPREKAKADRLLYLIANPNANQLFTTTPADLKTQIDALVDVVFAGQTVANRNKIKWLWNLTALVARESVAGE